MTEQELRKELFRTIPQYVHATAPYGISVEKCIDHIHRIYKQANYVKLADDQSLPRDFCQDIIDKIGPTREDAGSYKRAQQDMLKAGWRKVELKESDDRTGKAKTEGEVGKVARF